MSTKDSVLNALTACKGQFVSGEELSSQLGVSRTAVWKAIRALKQDGYPIDAVTHKGYMLIQDSWIITEESLRNHLPAEYKHNRIYLYDILDSTNIRAKQLAMENAPHGAIVMARQQTKGRGRLGRSFFAPREGIYITVIIKPNFDLSKSVLVTAAAAVAVAEAIEEVCKQEAKIKWVNDVYVAGKKVCGILTEGITGLETGQIEHLVIGMGVNTTLKDFPPELLEIAGAVEGDYNRSELAAAIISKTLNLVKTIEEKTFIKAYREKSLLIGRTVNVFKGTYKINPDDEIPSRPARVLDIDENGGLVVLYSDGARETLTSGEVTLRL